MISCSGTLQSIQYFKNIFIQSGPKLPQQEPFAAEVVPLQQQRHNNNQHGDPVTIAVEVFFKVPENLFH